MSRIELASGKSVFPYPVACVTNRGICRGPLLARIAWLTRAKPACIILREKDLAEDAYAKLAGETLEICRNGGVRCVLHGWPEVARHLDCRSIQLTLPQMRELPRQRLSFFSVRAVSVHSPEEAREAEELGATHLVAGHVFATSCKPGLAPRGTDFIRSVAAATRLPVFGIGGISAVNARAVLKAGARGVCIMSEAMQCEDFQAYSRSW